MLVDKYFFTRIYLIQFVLLIISCSPINAAKVTEHFSSQGFIDQFTLPYPVTYTTGHNELGDTINIEYQFNKTRQDQHYVIQIQFSPIRKMLIETDYLLKYKQSKSSQNLAKHKLDFPSVGLRAQYIFLGAGPGGMAEQLILTSSSNKYDVKILSSHLLPNNVELTPLKLEDIAIYIDRTLLNLK